MCKNRIIYNFNLTQVADAIVEKKGNIFEMHLLGIIENVL